MKKLRDTKGRFISYTANEMYTDKRLQNKVDEVKHKGWFQVIKNWLKNVQR